MAPVGVKMAANLFSFVWDLGLCKTQHLALLPAFQIFLRKKFRSRFKIVKSHYEFFADLGSIRKKSETRRGTSLLIIIDNLIRNPFLLASRVPPLVCIEHTTSTIDPTCGRACPIGIDLATWNETMHATDPFLPAIAYSLGKGCMRLSCFSLFPFLSFFFSLSFFHFVKPSILVAEHLLEHRSMGSLSYSSLNSV